MKSLIPELSSRIQYGGRWFALAYLEELRLWVCLRLVLERNAFHAYMKDGHLAPTALRALKGWHYANNKEGEKSE